MTREEFDDIRLKLLNIIQDSPPLAPRDLLHKLIKDGDLSDSQARDAIVRLIDDGDLHFNRRRKFEVAVPQR